MPDTLLKVFEIFSSIQGESSHAGLPCLFIRLAGCSLDCSYCDTREARDSNSGREMSVDEIVGKVKFSGLKLVEITGGEPLEQEAAPKLCARLLEDGFKVMLETNGSIDASAVPEGVARVIDFKTPSSGESQRMHLPNFRNLRRGDEVKFVMSGREDYVFALEKVREFGMDRSAGEILFSPVRGRLDAATLAAWMIVDKVPARLNMQIHKVVWGEDVKGV